MNEEENYLVSPYSIKIALGMLKEGAKENTFTEHESTIYNYNFRINEPKKIEYRVSCDDDVVISNGDFEENINVLSLLFVKKQTLDNMNNYSQQLIFNN